MPHKISLCAGPSEKRGTLKDLAPNPPPTLPPTAISPSLRVRVHIKNWSGTPVPLTAGDHYFKDPSHTSDHFSIQFFFTPPHDIPGDELVLCNTFSSPIRSKLPIFFGAAWAALLWVDPGIGGDPYTDSPEIYSRVLSAVNFMDVHGEVTGEEEEMGPVVEEHMPASIPAIPAKRKKFFLDARNQVKFTFKKGVEYRWDFCNGMMDFSDFSVRIPGLGFKFNVTKYWDHQPLRFVLKNKKTRVIYGVVQFDYEDEWRQIVNTPGAQVTCIERDGDGIGMDDAIIIDG